MDEKRLFFEAFVENPEQIGSIIPSSKFLIEEITKNIDFRSARCIVEYGPGTGRITSELLKNVGKDAKILCFEVNRNFYKYLQEKFRDKRLILVNDSAENVKMHMEKYGIKDIDYIISGLPFSTLHPRKKKIILEETKNTLGSTGKLVVYQFLSTIKKHLESYFTTISTSFVPLNIPPCFVCVCEK